LRTPRDAFGKSTSSSNMLCSRVKVHALNGENDSEANSNEGFKSKFSSIEGKTHLSVIGCSSASDTIDVSTNNSDVNFMHKSDQEIRSNLDLRIENCSTSGKQSSKEELNRCLKNISSHTISNAFLPHWVYRMYDSYWLAQRAAGSFSFLLLTLLYIFAFLPPLL
jgi:cereblon